MGMIKIIFALAISLLAMQCGSLNQGSDNSATACDQEGTVQDFTGLDGCSLMIVTGTDQKKLLPVSIEPADFKLEAGQRIRFSYTEAEGMANICMAEDMMVNITCIQLISANQ